MKSTKNGSRNVREATGAAKGGKQGEAGMQGFATADEIRKGILGFIPAVTRHLHVPEEGRAGEEKARL